MYVIFKQRLYRGYGAKIHLKKDTKKKKVDEVEEMEEVEKKQL